MRTAKTDGNGEAKGKDAGTISVFTFKDGLLARAAHDLAFRLERFEITLDDEELAAVLPLESLAVIGPVERGVVQSDKYDAARRAEVARTLHGEVLHSGRHPIARFAGKATARGDGFAVSGALALAGKTAPLAFAVNRNGDVYRARFELQPSRWGIAPYKALLGAIKLKDLVRVELELRET